MAQTRQKLTNFQKLIWGYYAQSGRHDLIWRHEITPYRILVSEVMLQQTQASRVAQKFPEFVARFPDFADLANASLQSILGAWQGLGYNRRALYLQRSTQVVMNRYAGELPSSPDLLVQLPGIGRETAGAIAAFAFNQPTVFIETNIRRVFIHHFFNDASDVSDQEIRPLAEEALDRTRPREWYWALMDYGAGLTRQTENPNRRSRHYTRQTAFAGSMRQLRGEVLRRLLEGPKTASQLPTDDRLQSVLEKLTVEGFIARSGRRYLVQ